MNFHFYNLNFLRSLSFSWLSVRDFLLILNIVFFNVVSAVNYTVFKQLWRPLDLVIHLHPAYSGPANDFTAFVSIDLHITCSDDYPLKRCIALFPFLLIKFYDTPLFISLRQISYELEIYLLRFQCSQSFFGKP